MMIIELAMNTLMQYRQNWKTSRLKTKFPSEMERRERYLNQLMEQLNHCEGAADLTELHLLADDIRHCLLHNYYPTVQTEESEDGFSFTHTLRDVADLLEMDEELRFAV